MIRVGACGPGAGLPQLFRVLHLCFLVPDHAETSVRIFGRADRPARCHALRGNLRRDADQRLALRQELRKTLALRGPDVCLCNRSAGPPRSTALNSTLDRVVRHGVYGLCLSPDILGDPNGDPEPVGGGGRSGHDQRCGQRSRFCRPSSVRLSERQNGSFSYGLTLMMTSALAGGLLILCIPKRARELGG